MSRLIISAAHTLESPGVIVGTLKEAELTRSILKKAIPHLEASGIEYKAVPLDLPLMQRINWINEQGFTEQAGDLFIEIHINDGGKRGFEFWYAGNASPENNSQKLAEEIMDHLVKKTGYTKQGVKSEHEHELGSLLILNQTKPIAAALELLYIDNEEDQAILKDETKLDELAKHLVDAVAEFIKKFPDIGKNYKPPVETDDFDDFLGDDLDLNLPGGNGLPPMPSFPSPQPFHTQSTAPSAFPKAPAAGKSAPLMMDKAEREKMIKETYSKLIGKDIPQPMLNQYLNQGVSEDELKTKILDSDDFKTLVTDAKGYKEEKDKATKAESELLTIRGKIADLETMVGTMQKVIDFKNQKIGELIQELERRGITTPGQYPGSQALKAKNDNDYPGLKNQPKKKTSVFDVLIRIFKLS
jgi:hypothetical protein